MPAPDNPFVDKTYGESLALVAGRFATREALVFRGERFTFAEVKRQVDRASARLAALGLSPGDKVALWLPNRPEFIWYWLGASQIGLVVVVLNTRLTISEVAYQLGQSDSRALIIPGDGAFRPFVREIAELCPELRTGVPGKLACAALPELRFVLACDPVADAMSGVTDWSAPAPDDLPMPALARDPDAPALISYSSGTTALPKGALLTHCVWRKAWDIGERADLTAADRLYLSIPLFGSMAMMNGVLPLWARGAAIIVEERFDADRCLRIVPEERCTTIHLLPQMIQQLAAHPGRRPSDLATLRIGWVLSSDRPVLEMGTHVLGIPGIMTGYGLTETTTVLTRNRWDDPLETRITTQGYPLPDVELRMVDAETGAEVPQGEIGEIWARGYCVMKGYYKKPEETARALTPDGWFRTGDLGAVDATGRLVFKGRLGEGYKSRGFNVSPAEIEAALLAHPAVAAAAVVGVPEPRHGAVGVAFVIARPDARATMAELLDWLRPRLSSFKLPQHIAFVSEFPLTAGTGKIQKFRLREQAMALLERGAAGTA